MACPELSCGEENLRYPERSEGSGVVLKIAANRSRQLGEVCASTNMEFFMAIRNVVQEGDDVLRKKCFEVTAFDEKLWQLLDDMKDTVREEEGAGLAAPQVGVSRRAVVVDVEEGFFEFVNPVIVQSKGEQRGWEGCLSVRGKRGIVTRPDVVKVEFFDRFGKKKKLTARGFFARAVCHELDHLDGILYIDRAEKVVRD